MLYGTSSSPMKRLYEKGTRNLIAISKSEVPESLVSILAGGARYKDLLISVIEAIGSTALYIKVAFLRGAILRQLTLLRHLPKAVFPYAMR